MCEYTLGIVLGFISRFCIAVGLGQCDYSEDTYQTFLRTKKLWGEFKETVKEKK